MLLQQALQLQYFLLNSFALGKAYLAVQKRTQGGISLHNDMSNDPKSGLGPLPLGLHVPSEKVDPGDLGFVLLASLSLRRWQPFCCLPCPEPRETLFYVLQRFIFLNQLCA